jgi:regulator of protease activity HflC (stomatin/prohibitin superfamily)
LITDFRFLLSLLAEGEGEKVEKKEGEGDAIEKREEDQEEAEDEEDILHQSLFTNRIKTFSSSSSCSSSSSSTSLVVREGLWKK